MILTLQIFLGIIIIACILLQTQDAGLGLWGEGNNNSYTTKRGLEKAIFYVTIISIAGFVFLSLLDLAL